MALGLFREHGFSGTSIEMIARAAQVTRPVVYACFPDKPSLFRALLDREERRLVGQITESLPKRPSLDDPEATLIAGFTAVLRAAAFAPDSWGLLFLSEHGSPEIAERVERARGEVHDQLAELARPVLASSDVDDPDGRLAALVAHLLMGNAEAGVRLMLSRPGEWSPDRLGAVVGRLVAPALDVLGRLSSEGEV